MRFEFEPQTESAGPASPIDICPNLSLFNANTVFSIHTFRENAEPQKIASYPVDRVEYPYPRDFIRGAGSRDPLHGTLFYDCIRKQ